MPDVTQLLLEIQQEAENASFPINDPVYVRAGLRPTQPIFYAGNLNSQLLTEFFTLLLDWRSTLNTFKVLALSGDRSHYQKLFSINLSNI